MRSWGCHMQHHAIYHKQNYSYAGVLEALSGAPLDVCFISFEDILKDSHILDGVDVIINVGDMDTAQSGGSYWTNETILTLIRRFVAEGGGFIGVGEPSATMHQGRLIQLGDILGVEIENGFTLGYDKYNWQEKEHFILEDAETSQLDFGEGKRNIYALEGTQVLAVADGSVQMAARDFGKGRGVYISGLPYNFLNSRILYRAVLYSCHGEEEVKRWYSTNYNVDVHAYVVNHKYCVVNNTYEPQTSTVYIGDGTSFQVSLAPNEIRWMNL